MLFLLFKQWNFDIKMFHIPKSILILHFLVITTQAIQWVRVGHYHNDVLPKTEIFHTSDQSYCTINSYYDATSNKYGDAGVTRGMMCDYVFEKGTVFGNASEASFDLKLFPHCFLKVSVVEVILEPRKITIDFCTATVALT